MYFGSFCHFSVRLWFFFFCGLSRTLTDRPAHCAEPQLSRVKVGHAPALVLSVFVSFVLLFYQFLCFLSLTALGSFLRSFFLCSYFVLFSYFFFVPAVFFFLSFLRSFCLSFLLRLGAPMFCSLLSLLGRLQLLPSNVDFTLRTAPTFIKSRARNTIIITPTIIISPKRVIFVGTRISIRFQLTLIGFQTYISGIIIAGVSRDGDRSIEGGEGGGDLLMRSEH